MKVRNSILKFENDFVELKGRELKVSEMEELFFKPIIGSMDDMNKFEQK